MKIVINKCFGGFSLSLRAVSRLYKLKKEPCYFFRSAGVFSGPYQRITLEDAEKLNDLHVSCFSVKNPDDFTSKQLDEYFINCRPEDRSDPDLVRVVEELGARANGRCAELAVVDIPDDVEYTIEEYDGLEHVAEVHRTWS